MRSNRDKNNGSHKTEQKKVENREENGWEKANVKSITIIKYPDTVIKTTLLKYLI